MLKTKVAYGLTLERKTIKNNDDRELPIDEVEAHKYVKHFDDGF